MLTRCVDFCQNISDTSEFFERARCEGVGRRWFLIFQRGDSCKFLQDRLCSLSALLRRSCDPWGSHATPQPRHGAHRSTICTDSARHRQRVAAQLATSEVTVGPFVVDELFSVNLRRSASGVDWADRNQECGRLHVTKLDHTGRKLRAGLFMTLRDLVALQIKSLGRAGAACWYGIWRRRCCYIQDTVVSLRTCLLLYASRCHRTSANVGHSHKGGFGSTEVSKPLLAAPYVDVSHPDSARFLVGCSIKFFGRSSNSAGGLADTQDIHISRGAICILETCYSHMRPEKEMNLQMSDGQVVM